MERLLDDLIGHVRAVKITRINVIHARSYGLTQHRDGARNIARRTPDHLAWLPPRKLHGAIAHAVDGAWGVKEGKCAAQIFWLS